MAWLIGGVLLAAWLAGPGVAEAGELTLGAETRLGYDSNVFNRESEVDSGVFTMKLFGEVKDELERGSYTVSYRPTYLINETSEAGNSWNHLASARGVYNFSPRTSVSVSNDFSFVEKLIPSPSEDVDPNFDDSARRTIRDTSTIHFRHLLTRLLSTNLTGTYTIYRYSRDQDEDNENFAGNASMNYAISSKLRLGGGGAVRYATFDSAGNQGTRCADEPAGSHTLSYSGFVSGSYQYDQTTSVLVQAGPARIETSSFLCSGTLPSLFFQKETTSQLTWFATGELLKRWRHVKISLRYRRAEGLGSVGTSTINDSLTARLNWQPARYWNFGLQVGWLQRIQDQPKSFVLVGATIVSLKRNTDSTQWTASASLSRRILRRLRASLNVSYRNQNEDPQCSPDAVCTVLFPSTPDRDFDSWRASFGLTYQFDPIRY